MTIKEKARLQRGYKNFLRRLYSKQVKKKEQELFVKKMLEPTINMASMYL